MEGGRGVEKRGWRGRGSMEGRELVGGWECVEGGGMDGGNEFGGGGGRGVEGSWFSEYGFGMCSICELNCR